MCEKLIQALFGLSLWNGSYKTSLMPSSTFPIHNSSYFLLFYRFCKQNAHNLYCFTQVKNIFVTKRLFWFTILTLTLFWFCSFTSKVILSSINIGFRKSTDKYSSWNIEIVFPTIYPARTAANQHHAPLSNQKKASLLLLHWHELGSYRRKSSRNIQYRSFWKFLVSLY